MLYGLTTAYMYDNVIRESGQLTKYKGSSVFRFVLRVDQKVCLLSVFLAVCQAGCQSSWLSVSVFPCLSQNVFDGLFLSRWRSKNFQRVVLYLPTHFGICSFSLKHREVFFSSSLVIVSGSASSHLNLSSGFSNLPFYPLPFRFHFLVQIFLHSSHLVDLLE